MKRLLVTLLATLVALGASAQVRPSKEQIRELRERREVKLDDGKKLRPLRPEKPVKAEQKLKVETFYLKNGLKVIVAEEHSQPKIYGAVLVHAGSKNEDTNATGVAHYFEHIMFKGTDRIGTTDWTKEKPILDKISDAYDALQAANDDSTRHRIQLEINRMNIEASKYAIPNEVDAILQQMGCTGLNAGTSYDQTVYYNTLPSNQLENWMKVYAERFRNPVYRLFQTELEAVYEERNMYSNEQMYAFSRNIFKESFGEHPYSRDIIGLDKHLKNPQPSAMKRFYDKYYVASNMTLILVGDLDAASVKHMAERYFGRWPKGEKAKPVEAVLPKFDGRVVKEVKQTPIRVGLMIFPGVKNTDPDNLALEMLNEILMSGNNGLAALATRGELMAAMHMPMSLNDAGSNVILFVPKLIGQKFETAEELIWAAIDSVKEGRFSEKQFESIRMRNMVERKRQIEDYNGIASLLLELEGSGSSYELWNRDFERMQKMTKEDVMAVAKKYFDLNRVTIIRSGMGFPDKESAIKPDWDHLDAPNKGVQSPFAKSIAAAVPVPVKPQEVDFNNECTIVKVNDGCNLYASQNPKNDLFSLTINYHYGNYDNKMFEVATEYFNNLGMGEMTLEDLDIELGCLGGSFSVFAGDDWSGIQISGPERNMNRILDIATKKLKNPRHDKQQIDNLIDGIKASKSQAKDDADTWFAALREYVMYGDSSTYLNHPTLKEVKKLKGEAMMDMINAMFARHGYITYVGNAAPEAVANMVKLHKLTPQGTEAFKDRMRQPKPFEGNQVFYCTNKNFLQSNIVYFMPAGKFDLDDEATCLGFNEYFGGGMNSVVFQEIRELRSLGYSAFGQFNYDRRGLKPANLTCYLGTQCDKTIDGIGAMTELMKDFPERKEKFDGAKDYLIAARNSNYITFRQLPEWIRWCKEELKVGSDPRPEVTKRISMLTYDDLKAFHDKYIKNRPMVIMVSGNDKKFDKKALEGFGKVTKVKYKKMIKF